MQMDTTQDTGLSQDIQSMEISDAIPKMDKDFLYELVENHMLQFGELVQASNSITRADLQLDSIWTSWDRLQNVLQGLGFQWDGKDPWHMYGLSLNEGPSPTLALIEQRWDLAQLILQGAAGQKGLQRPMLEEYARGGRAPARVKGLHTGDRLRQARHLPRSSQGPSPLGPTLPLAL